jgi:IclR family acetate operon transcriptional repressor
VSLGELAGVFERPKTTVHRALVTLHEAGWIWPSGHERTRWVLTPRVVGLARRAGDALGVREVARPIMERLRDEANESVLLAFGDDATWTVVDFVEGRRPVRFVPNDVVGFRYPMHAGANGKAILASFEPARLDAYLQQPLARLTQRTVVDPDALRAELAQVRANGFAATKGETNDEEAAGIAAPIFDLLGEVTASVAIAYPAHRSSPSLISGLQPLVIVAAARVTAALSGRSI